MKRTTVHNPAFVKVKLADLKRLVEYNYEDEARHYEECRMDGPCPDHIFPTIRRLNRAVENAGR